MGQDSKIEWTHHTFNPWIGCTKVSDGCKFCYAETLASTRLELKVWGPTAARQAKAESAWRDPIRWNKLAKEAGERHRVFCASLADVFEGPETCQNGPGYAVIKEGRRRLWDIICQTPHLDWLLLTKRPENILRFTPGCWAYEGSWPGEWPANVWVGTSVENQDAADRRIPELLKVPAPVRFLSCEPLLGPVSLRHCLKLPGMPDYVVKPYSVPFEYIPVRGIDWVIVGGESGPHARPMSLHWARSLRDQCHGAAVPFFFKQWGEFRPFDEKVDKAVYSHNLKESRWHPATDTVRVGKKAAGRLLDGRTWDELPNVAPEVPGG